MTSTIDMVDRFSSLPNELLNLIFDHTYIINAPSAPISKRFLPFHRIHLYRSIHLSSPQQLRRLSKTVKAKKPLGPLVRSLTLPPGLQRSTKVVAESSKLLKKLLPLLPNLEHLDAKDVYYIVDVIESIGRSSSLSRSVTNFVFGAPEVPHGEFMETEDLYKVIQNLESLENLTLYYWNIYDSGILDARDSSVFPQIKTLQIHGEGAEDLSISEIIQMFPLLLDLTLHSTYIDLSRWSYALSLLPRTLESLTLLVEHYGWSPADHDLLPFISLKRIHLDQACFSPTISHIFRQLPLVEKIHLGDGPLDIEAFLCLVIGPSRLVHLRHLILDLDCGSFGPCITIRGTEVVLEENDDGETCWDLPEQFLDGVLDRLSMTRLVEVARSSGIRVEGTILKALKVLKLHCIDSNNRAVLAYSGPTDFRRLHKIRMEALRYDYRFPELDFDSLERDKLEIVETKLEESKWSVFGFKEKEK